MFATKGVVGDARTAKNNAGFFRPCCGILLKIEEYFGVGFGVGYVQGKSGTRIDFLRSADSLRLASHVAIGPLLREMLR